GVVVVVVVFSVVAVVPLLLVPGWMNISCARTRRLLIPWWRLLRRPASTEEGSELKSSSVLRSAASVAVQSPFAFSAALRTASKSLSNAPGGARGTGPSPGPPQETSSAAATPAIAARLRRSASARRRGSRAGV